MKEVIAGRQLRGVYGSLNPGESKVIDDDIAAELAARGLVQIRAQNADQGSLFPALEHPSTPVHETKPEAIPVKSGVTIEYPSPAVEMK